MCMETADQTESTDVILNFVNNIFIGVFTIECFLKLIALSWRYFTIPWNIFDISIVVLSILGKICFLFSSPKLKLPRFNKTYFYYFIFKRIKNDE